MKPEDIKYKIDQLRKDKIIYATEACAASLVCLLGLVGTDIYFRNTVFEHIGVILFLTIAFGYTIYMGIGNFFRLKKIKELEKKL